MATTRIKDLDQATNLNGDDAFAVDGESAGTRKYGVAAFRSEILNTAAAQAQAAIDDAMASINPMQMNPFNLDYANTIRLDLGETGEGGKDVTYTAVCDAMFRIPNRYSYESGTSTYGNDMYKVLSIDGVSLYENVGMKSSKTSCMFNSFGTVDGYYDIFLEAGQTIGMKTSLSTNSLGSIVWEIPVRNGKIEESLFRTVEVPISDLLSIELTGTHERTEYTSGDDEWKELSAYFDGIDASTRIVEITNIGTSARKALDSGIFKPAYTYLRTDGETPADLAYIGMLSGANNYKANLSSNSNYMVKTAGSGKYGNFSIKID